MTSLRTPGGHRRYTKESLEALMQPIAKANGAQAEDYTNPRRSSIYSELGVSGLNRFGGAVFTEEQRELRGLSGRRLYREMRLSDPVLAAVFFAVSHAIKQVDWRTTPASEEEADKKAAEFVESAREDMSFTWNDTMTFIVDSVLEQGLALMECVYKRRLGEKPSGYTGNPATSQYDDGKIGWRKLAPRPVESLVEGNEWIFDDNGGIKGINQLDPSSGKLVSIPIEKLLMFRTTVYPANTPEPPPIHRAAYRPYYYTSNLEEIEGIGVERDLGGIPVIYMGRNLTMEGANSDYEMAQKLVVNIRRDEQTGVVLPGPKMGGGAPEGEGWLLELLSANGSRAHNITEIVERYDKRKALIVLAQFIMLGMSQVGSYALSRHQGDLFVMAVSAWVNSIAEIFNRHAIPRLMKLNSFPGITGYPKLVPSAIGVPDLQGIADYVNKLVDKQVLTPDEELERHLRQLADLPERVIPEEEEAKPQVEKVIKAEKAGKLSPQGKKALALTDQTQAEIEREWRKLQDNIAGGMAIKGAIALYKRAVDRLLDTAFDEAWAIGRGGQFDPEERKQIEVELAAQREYLDNFAKELSDKLSSAADKDEQGGILLANVGRAAMYAGAIWGLYNMAKTFGFGPESVWQWEGPIDAKTCAGCAEEVKAGARPLSKIRRRPGEADCLVNCRHELMRVR